MTGKRVEVKTPLPDLSGPVKFADGVYWVGVAEPNMSLKSNPYLVIDNDEAVLIDGGSRPDFPGVMTKILQTGISPDKIQALIYQHADPDLCSSLPHFEDLITTSNLAIISEKSNHAFLSHYPCRSRISTLEEINFRFRFSSGRELEFLRTPYAHALGSTVTLDHKSGVLFSSDLFGSYSTDENLFLNLMQKCSSCSTSEICPETGKRCQLHAVLAFHRMFIPTSSCLRYAMNVIEKTDFRQIASQHGQIITKRDDALLVIKLLKSCTDVGIEQFLKTI